MIRVEPFEVEHALELTLQPSQAQQEVGWHDRRKLAMAYAEAGNAFSIREVSWKSGTPVAGRLLFCGGAVERHGEHASLWALFAAGKRFAMPRILTKTRAFIAKLPHRRVDCLIVSGDAKAARWAELCGLTYETTIREAAPDGGDLLIYRYHPAIPVKDAVAAEPREEYR